MPEPVGSNSVSLSRDQVAADAGRLPRLPCEYRLCAEGIPTVQVRPLTATGSTQHQGDRVSTLSRKTHSKGRYPHSGEPASLLYARAPSDQLLPHAPSGLGTAEQPLAPRTIMSDRRERADRVLVFAAGLALGRTTGPP